jgi:tRNA-Thr(GGU) m(6)t(6)A37 methyltransferase TsaA
MKIEYHPIGRFHTSLSPQTGAPRQGILEPGSEGTIEIFEQYRDALADLDNYDYIIVIYHLHLSTTWHTPVRPPASERTFGLFATRSPNRPNPIGFAVVKLREIKNARLHVSGVDAFDGSPVLDIKAWMPSLDCPPHSSNRDVEKEIGL